MLALFFVPADIDLLTQNKRRNTSIFSLILTAAIFTVWRYTSEVYAVVMCPSVCLSIYPPVCQKPALFIPQVAQLSLTNPYDALHHD